VVGGLFEDLDREKEGKKCLTKKAAESAAIERCVGRLGADGVGVVSSEEWKLHRNRAFVACPKYIGRVESVSTVH
jgi:hypothetical protein